MRLPKAIGAMLVCVGIGCLVTVALIVWEVFCSAYFKGAEAVAVCFCPIFAVMLIGLTRMFYKEQP